MLSMKQFQGVPGAPVLRVLGQAYKMASLSLHQIPKT